MPRRIDQLKKPWVVMPLVAMLALGGWWTLVRDDGTTATDGASPTDQVVEVTVGDMAKTLTAEGTVEAADTEELSFTSAGTVTAVNVAAGDEVAAGDVLAEIDSAELDAAVAEAEAQVADAEAQLADDTDGGASDEQLAADESAVTSANDQLAAAQDALEGAQLVAGFDGTVATVELTVGEELTSGGTGGTTPTGSGSGSGGSASTLGTSSAGSGPGASTGSTTSTSSADITLTTTGSYTVSLGFDDTDVTSLATGQVATVALATTSSSSTQAFPGFPGGGFPGGGFPGGQATASTGGADGGAGDDTASGDDEAAMPSTTGDGVDGLVTEVGTIADASSGVASYPVTVAFQDASGDFNVGASVSVTITYAQEADALSVPTRAITTADGTSTVEVATGDGTETRTVELGLVDGTMTQVTSGLVAGESVVIAGPSFGGPGGTGGGFAPPDGAELPAGAAPDATAGAGS